MKRYAVVRNASVDVRRHPSHRSELRSQLLMGEVVRILSVRGSGRWSRVENKADGYRGWVRAWGLFPVTEAEAEAWSRSARWRVARSHIELRSGPGRGEIVGPLFWNSPVAEVGSSGAHVRLRLPDGTHGWTQRRNLRPANRRAGRLEDIVGRFSGIPYLWGGRTPLGFDFSGFVQQVLAGVGVEVPRDAHQQFLVSRRSPAARSPRKGELMFFGRRGGRMTHVAIALGKGLFAHAQGTVHVNSLSPSNPLYDKRLAASLRSIGRP